MKIAHVVDSMEIGGAETLVLQMCRLQREQGHDPRVYAIAGLGALGEQMQSEGFVVQARTGDHFLDTSRRFFRIFRESCPDVVHLHNPTPTIYAALPARMAGISSVVSTRHSLVEPPHKRVVELKYAVAARCCNWIVGICDATADNLFRLHTLPARKIVRVYNGAVALERAAPDHVSGKRGFTLLYVGRLAPVKNLPFLFEAFQRALPTIPQSRLWIVGDGSERPALEDMAGRLKIAHCTTFWGQQLDVARYFSEADAFVMSSKSEGLPMSLLQAFSLGLPAIVTDVGGMAEVVRLAQAGLTVSLTDPGAMAEAIIRLAFSEADRRRFASAAAQAFHSMFSLQSMVTAYEELYRNIRPTRSLMKK